FGKGEGELPKSVENFRPQRQQDRRDITLTWDHIKDAQGYNIKWGIAPDKLYSSWLVYGKNEHQMKSLGRDQTYYFAVEAFNENGISKLSEIVEVK
ncbi:MAG TPA: fibronectin type III domain-containing protein, partial [Cyclobacteriaceae bacterium]|nr:fibronectin type III domain-containing protein [Cyclobacteriaceae bacterium]